jgi:hypothetical protein
LHGEQLWLRRLGVQDTQALKNGHLGECRVGDNEMVKKTLTRKIECDRKLKCIERSQAVREAVLPDQPLGFDEVIVGHAEHLDIAGGDIEQQPSALYASGGLVQHTGSDFHGEGGLNLNEPHAGDSELSAGLSVDGGNSWRSRFCVNLTAALVSKKYCANQ